MLQLFKSLPLQIKILLFGGVFLLIVYTLGFVFAFLFPREQALVPQVPIQPSQEDMTPAEIVKEKSTRTITTIENKLPYTRRYALSNGITVTTSIQKTDDPSALAVTISGIDFTIDEDDPDYFLMYRSFNEAALDAYDWIEEQGGTRTYLSIQWSEDPEIQQTAYEWLHGH
jgi:hypothetical protein